MLVSAVATEARNSLSAMTVMTAQLSKTQRSFHVGLQLAVSYLYRTKFEDVPKVMLPILFPPPPPEDMQMEIVSHASNLKVLDVIFHVMTTRLYEVSLPLYHNLYCLL